MRRWWEDGVQSHRLYVHPVERRGAGLGGEQVGTVNREKQRCRPQRFLPRFEETGGVRNHLGSARHDGKSVRGEGHGIHRTGQRPCIREIGGVVDDAAGGHYAPASGQHRRP